jgi:2-polyprenylphenol 6-hydroxylase
MWRYWLRSWSRRGRVASAWASRVLGAYARRRRGDNAAMLALMDGFRLLFGTPSGS